jgi:acetyl-CoA carboxylase carboxyltransferase component
MLELVSEIESLHTQVLEGGGAKAVDRHRGRGKLLARERIELLVDRDSAFLELSPLAAAMTDEPLGSGVITGIGVVAGVECVISANDPTVIGGALGPTAMTKALRAQEIARCNGLPLINLNESGGADLARQADIFVPGGAMFKNITQLSAAGIPSLTLVFGSSTAGGAYVPGMSDYTVFVRGNARVYLGGPPLVKMAIDEDVDDETLGGAEMHASISGLADYLAADESDAIRLARRIVANLGWCKLGEPVADVPVPLRDPEELLGIVPAELHTPFDMREVLSRVVDGSEFDEFKTLYGSQLVTGWGRVGGFPLGVIANNGIIFSEEAQKGAQFIQLCNRRHVPILFVHNITGFMVGREAEEGGIIKDGAKLINAVSNSTVPHLALMIGSSYGAGHYGMSGRSYDPRFVFAWPTSRTAVMGGRQLGGVMSIIRRAADEKAGREFDETHDAEMRASLEAQIDRESHALFATGRLWDDGIIDPRDTRTVLTIALSAVRSPALTPPAPFGVFRM